jgi:hypothetical protein
MISSVVTTWGRERAHKWYILTTYDDTVGEVSGRESGIIQYIEGGREKDPGDTYFLERQVPGSGRDDCIFSRDSALFCTCLLLKP